MCDESKPSLANQFAAQLLDISIIFIPFEAVGPHYIKNAESGVNGVQVTFENNGYVSKTHPQQFVPPHGYPNFLQKGDVIGAHLEEIVQQECDLFRATYINQAFGVNHQKFVATLNPEFVLQPKQELQIIKRLGAYSEYPILIFLSENPTKSAFPEKINFKPQFTTHYVKQAVLDRKCIPNIRAVNEMAVYLRNDIQDQINSSKHLIDDGLYIETTAITRETFGLPNGGKPEYILKVRIGQKSGHSLTVAGVHLRAKLTGQSNCEDEWKHLQQFCTDQGIQIMIGDFNMDLQKTEQGKGHRGAFLPHSDDLTWATAAEKEKYMQKHKPYFIVGDTPRSANISFQQQFSNSTGDKHYMGFFQADNCNLVTTGVGVYGSQGGSGSRFLKSTGQYYSDHPSIYVKLASTLVSKTAAINIQQRILSRQNHDRYGSHYSLENKQTVDAVLVNKDRSAELLWTLWTLGGITPTKPVMYDKDSSISIEQPIGVLAITGDGNCLFRAISYAIFNQDAFYPYFRQAVVEYMTKNAQYFINHGIDAQYIHDMGLDGTWAGAVEIMVLSNMLNRSIRVYKPFGTMYIPPRFNQTQPTINLLYCNYSNPKSMVHVFNHYNFIADIDDFLGFSEFWGYKVVRPKPSMFFDFSKKQ